MLMNNLASHKDRNALTFTLSSLFLATIVLGIGFKPDNEQPEVLYSMEIILSKKSNLEAPEEADFLAQNNQLGGGNQDEKVRPQNITSATAQMAEGISQQHTEKQTKNHLQQQKQQTINSKNEQLKIEATDRPTEQKQQQSKQEKETPEQKLARIERELAKKLEQYAKKPRSKYISSSSKAYEYAPYIHKWVKKIERTGDLNYPEKAKQKNFQGNVMLTVGIKKDGRVHEVKVIKSSGYRFLDEAAKHIVELAQPFDPLPETKERVDILYITRTWQFLPGHLLRHK